jgi:hypothetical protein
MQNRCWVVLTPINTEIIYLTCFCDLSSNCFVVGYFEVLHDKKGRNEYTIYGIQIHGPKKEFVTTQC